MARGTLYDILGVDPEASGEQIRRAYRAAARKLHPDANPSPDAEARFKELANAYETLADPERRQAYDISLATPGTGPHFTWTNIADSGASVSWAEEERKRKETEFDEMYDAYFGEHKAPARAAKPRARKQPPL